ncbi:MAG: carbohydrate ABC transporter permease [Verrucomicrobia bacterium]|nr:carbohydrate ABC transporter permease [Verrucomicrobiota bacterium]
MRRASTFLRHGGYLIVGSIFFLPLWWAFSSSLKPLAEVFHDTSPFHARALLPVPLDPQAYGEIFQKGFGRALWNSALVAFLSVTIGLAVNGCAGFAFAVLSFPGKNLLFALTVFTFLVPSEAIAVPLYTVVRNLGWLDTYAGLVVPGLANGITIFLFRQFFAQIPRELAEAARVDGAGWLTILLRIYVPLCKPVIISAGLLIFLFQWEAFLWPLIATRSESMRVVQVALSSFEQQHQTLWNELFAASVISAGIPLLILLPLQRYYIQGVVGASLKG